MRHEARSARVEIEIARSCTGWVIATHSMRESWRESDSTSGVKNHVTYVAIAVAPAEQYHKHPEGQWTVEIIHYFYFLFFIVI